jgi:hypothetical protein
MLQWGFNLLVWVCCLHVCHNQSYLNVDGNKILCNMLHSQMTDGTIAFHLPLYTHVVHTEPCDDFYVLWCCNKVATSISMHLYAASRRPCGWSSAPYAGTDTGNDSGPRNVANLGLSNQELLQASGPEQSASRRDHTPKQVKCFIGRLRDPAAECMWRSLETSVNRSLVAQRRSVGRKTRHTWDNRLPWSTAFWSIRGKNRCGWQG